MSEWENIVEKAIKRCKEMEAQARKERKIWETLQKRLPEAEHRPFPLLSLIDQLRKLNSPSVHELEQLEAMLRQKSEEQILHIDSNSKAANGRVLPLLPCRSGNYPPAR